MRDDPRLGGNGGTFLVAAVVAILLAAALWGPRVYGSNDNFGIIDNARAGYPTPYTGFAFTYGLHLLYGVWPGVPWLALTLYALLLSAAAVTSYLVSVDCRSRAIKAAAGIIVTCCFLPFMFRLDYNASSILLGGSAVYLLAFSGDSRRGPWFSALIVLMCYCSYSTRLHGLIGSVCLAAPFALCAFWRAGRAKRLQMALVAVAVAVLVAADQAVYKANMPRDYRQYIAFDEVRRVIHNSPYLRSGIVDPKLLTAAGWSENDYWLFAQWFYLDEDRFNVRTVSVLRKFVREGSPALPPLMPGLGVLWGEFASSISLMLAVSVLPFLWKGLGTAIWAAFALVATAFGALLLEAYWYFPDHIALPVIAEAALGFVCIALPLPSRSRFFEWVGVGIVVLVVACLAVTAARRHRVENAERNGAFARTLERLDALPADSVILFGGGTLQMDWADPIRPWGLKPHQVRTGMSIFSPVFYAALHQVGLKRASELIPFLASSGRGYVVASAGAMPHLARFAREAYGLELEASPLGTLESGAQIFRLSLGTGRH
jgi:hypothetical protein